MPCQQTGILSRGQLVGLCFLGKLDHTMHRPYQRMSLAMACLAVLHMGGVVVAATIWRPHWLHNPSHS